MKSYDLRAKQEDQLRAVDKKVREATLENLEAQKHGQRPSLEKHAELSKERRDLVESMKSDDVHHRQEEPSPHLGKRIRRLPVRFAD